MDEAKIEKLSKSMGYTYISHFIQDELYNRTIDGVGVQGVKLIL